MHFLRLMRPANILTAIADILLGCFVLGAQGMDILWLVLATIGLYGGGVVFNDVFDAELDKVERPERPIPSGKVSLLQASVLGSALLVMGITCGFMAHTRSGIIAVIIALLALSYDKYAKHHPIWGPLNMGACRSGNLLLGLSSVAGGIAGYWFLAFIPLLYIGMITMISRGEVHGGKKTSLSLALLMYALVISVLLGMEFIYNYDVVYITPFLILFIYLTIPALYKAYETPDAVHIRMAVKAGVVSLIVLDATIAAGFSGWLNGALVLLCLPVSMLMAKWFAVT